MFLKIYGLVDPRTDEIHYVGRTTSNLEDRRRAHMGAAPVGSPMGDWMTSLFAAELEPVAVLLETVKPGRKQREAYWIHYGLDNGWPLCNRQIPNRPKRNPQRVFDEERQHKEENEIATAMLEFEDRVRDITTVAKPYPATIDKWCAHAVELIQHDNELAEWWANHWKEWDE